MRSAVKLRKAEKYLLYRMRGCVDAKETQGDSSSYRVCKSLEFLYRYFVGRSLDEEWVFTPTKLPTNTVAESSKSWIDECARKQELVRI